MKISTPSYLREVELQWVVCGESNSQSSLEEVMQGVLVVVKEEVVVAKGRHHHANLGKREEGYVS